MIGGDWARYDVYLRRPLLLCLGLLFPGDSEDPGIPKGEETGSIL